MKKLFKIFGCGIAFCILVFIGLSIFVSNLDANAYRPKLVDIMSRQTGRAVKLSGPITFSLGLDGVHVSAQDASIANPSWASRPTMAGMGKFELGVGLLPLLNHRILVKELSIENADILLETNAQGQHNWDFSTEHANTSSGTPSSAPSSPISGSLNVKSLQITNSQLAIRNADGTLSSYNIAALKLATALKGAELTFKGDINGIPITANVKTSIMNLLSTAPFTYEADVVYDVLHFTAKGNADLDHHAAEISKYELQANKSDITGKASVEWGGVRPLIRGSLESSYINMADFKLDAANKPEAGASSMQGETISNKRIFSETPLPLETLKSVDTALTVSISDFVLGKGELKKISAQLSLDNGNLVLAPLTADVGGSMVQLQLKLNATQSPTHLTIGIITNDVDLGDLQKLGDMTPFMEGRAGANIQLEGDGNSPHDIASSLGGVVNITAEKGEILTGAAAGVSTALAAVFSPQGNNAAINCLAARFIVKNGILNDNGILIDTSVSTVSGKGDVNLGNETVALNLSAKTKLVDVGGLVPTLQISGALSDPKYSVDAVGVVKSVVGSLMNGNVDVISSAVPDIQTAPSGENACVYTLDHPKAASSSSILPSTPLGQASQKIQNIGNSLVKGLFGH